MQTFQIKEKTRRATQKMVNAESGKGELYQKQQIKPRKKQAKDRLRKGGEPFVFERIDKSGEDVVPRAARKPQQGAEQKGMQVAHLKIPESFPFPAP